MKQEDVSQYVTRVTSRSTRVRSRSRPNFCSVPYIHRFVVYRDRFVVSIVQFCGDHYIILQCPPQTLQCPPFGTTKICSVRFIHYKTLQCSLFSTTKIHNLPSFPYKLCDIHFFITKFCSTSILILLKFVVFTSQHQKNPWCLGLQKFEVSAFFIRKLCSVRFLALQKFIVSSFFIIKVCNICLFITKVDPVHFFIQKVCSISFLETTDICGVCSFRKQKSVLVSCNVLHSDEVHVDVVQCFTGAELKSLATEPSIIQSLYPPQNYAQD